MAAVVIAIAATTTATSTTFLLQNNKNDHVPAERINCPSYGCPLLPRDILYDKKSQQALERLRTNEETDAAKLELLSSGDSSTATLTLIGFKGGDPNHQINQDRAFCIAPYMKNDCKLLGVFDGHARRGELVSEHSVQSVPSILASKLRLVLEKKVVDKEERTLQIRRCIEETFVEVDRTAPASPSGGCTASIILQVGTQLYIANAGDSRSFIGIHHNNKDTYVVYQSREDKPELPDERDRIERMGGRVYIPMQGTSRVMYLDRTTGTYSGLAMSRAIGDWDATGVIATPTIDVVEIQELLKHYDNDDEVHVFAVSATDGMMDFVPIDVVANVIGPSLSSTTKDHPLTACERLIGLAANRWDHAKQGQYRDDIAIAVSKIHIPKK